MARNKEETEKLHKEILYTQVRVKTKTAGGSGTVIYSMKNGEAFSNYILTCHHVIESALKVKKEYDPRIGMDRKKEFREAVTVEFFDYLNVPHGHRPISSSVDADIMAYDKDHDMALIKLRTTKQSPYVAKFLPKNQIENIMVGMECHAVGCALLHDPILTSGEITHMGDEAKYKDYWMSSAQIIFGNSGGAIFLDGETSYFIGIPSMVDILGWSTPVTHLGYFSPIHRIYQFLNEQNFQFIYDHAYTEDQCEKKRNELKEEASKRLWRVEPEESESEEKEE